MDMNTIYINTIQTLTDSALRKALASQKTLLSTLEACLNIALKSVEELGSRASDERLDVALKRVDELERKVQELSSPNSEQVFRWARSWRGLMALVGLGSPGLGLASILTKSKNALMAMKMAWAS